MKDIVVLIPSSGSNSQTIIDAYDRGQINGALWAIFSDEADAFGLERVYVAGIPAHALAQSQPTDREAFDRQLIHGIGAYAPDLVVLVGYMRILSPTFISHYRGRLPNIYPPLLPRYPGLHIHRQVLEDDDEEHGTSVYFVTDELDDGPVILQTKVSVFAGDSGDEMTARVQVREHAIYPLVINWFVDGRLHMTGDHAQLDEQQLPPQGCAAEE